MTYGATPEDWAHLDLICGLTADLLPVVSRPEAPIAPGSTLKGLGKTPSRYNGRREVVGIGAWTSKHATPAELTSWSRELDYGICLQTRRVRGLDIDVPDPELAGQIADAFDQYVIDAVPRPLPRRTRSNSGKQLLAFVVEGDLAKRSFRVEGGLVEFLATGQQFIACGTHPSGARYEWQGGLPDEFPVVDLETFEAAWAAIVEQFAIAPERGGVAAGPRPTGDLGNDEVAGWLAEHWETFGADKGKLFVCCPWKDGHSSDSGETEAAWLMEREGAPGQYRCLHASCDGRTREEFLQAVGYVADGFEVLPAVVEGEALEAVAPGFARDARGAILATVGNVQAALTATAWMGCEIRFDEFKAEIVWRPGGAGWRTFKDEDYTALRIQLEQLDFKPVSSEMIRNVVHLVAHERSIDTAMQWIDTLVWDGTPRVERFWSTYFGVEDTPYARACGLYAWTALAGRVLVPGVKADMVPILTGEQGLGKSSGIEAMSPAPDYFAEFNLADRDADMSRKMRGTLVGELAELRGLRSREAESIKAWVTQRHERWTPKYQEFEISFPRRLVFFGTTNDDDFLADATGERRWLPMVCGPVDVAAIQRDREQLWAEARFLFEAGGVLWGEAQALAVHEHGKFRARDIWEEPLRKWLTSTDLAGQTPLEACPTSLADIATAALGLDVRSIKRAEEMRIAQILRDFGCEKQRVQREGVRVWAYVLKSA
jgi:predicted P-loop ATPase